MHFRPGNAYLGASPGEEWPDRFVDPAICPSQARNSARLSSELSCLAYHHIDFFLENRLAGRVAQLDVMGSWA